MKKITLIILSFLFSFGSFSQDTFSIVAVDTITGEVGSAGASCIHIFGNGVMILSDVHPGVGVIHTQAWYHSANQTYAKSLMDMGVAPQQIIDSLIANDYQNNPTLRQYGIVDFRDGEPRTAAYTGVNTDDYKNHIIGPNYTIQGNILLGQKILDSMEARFLRAEGELACRLMEALQGANVPGADTRCLPDGISSIGAFLRVAKPDDPANDLYLQFNLPKVDDGVDPIDSLQVLVDLWGGCYNTGIPNVKDKSNMMVYPNPASESVTFKLTAGHNQDETDVVIYNSIGQTVHRINHIHSEEVKWNVELMPDGIYLYKVLINGELNSTGKLVIR